MNVFLLAYYKSKVDGVTWYSCKSCHKKYDRYTSMYAHGKRCDVNPQLICHICEEKFARKEDLKNHIKTHQTQSCAYNKSKVDGVTWYSCKFCDKKYNRYTSMYAHGKQCDLSPQFMCHICETKFAQEEHLKYHIKTHQTQSCGEPRRKYYISEVGGNIWYCCKICHKQFQYHTSVYLHDKENHRSPRLQCDSCSKKFSRKEDLKSHILEVHQVPST